MDTDTTQKKDDRIVLLDLNYTLCADSRIKQSKMRSLGLDFAGWIETQETYREDLLNAIRDRYVILITARPWMHRDRTLRRIESELGWQPQEAYFQPGGMRPPDFKEMALQNDIGPKHGMDGKRYLGIESNPQTRRMYADYGIESTRYEWFMGILPTGQEPPRKPKPVERQISLF